MMPCRRMKLKVYMNFSLLKKSRLQSRAGITGIIIMTGNHQDFKGWQCSLVPTGKMKSPLYVKNKEPGRKSKENVLFKLFHHRNEIVVQKWRLVVRFQISYWSKPFFKLRRQECDSSPHDKYSLFHRMLFSFFSCWGFPPPLLFVYFMSHPVQNTGHKQLNKFVSANTY